jgi:hypothetical protein
MTNKAAAVVAALTYETNTKKEDFDLVPGDNLTLNWASANSCHSREI